MSVQLIKSHACSPGHSNSKPACVTTSMLRLSHHSISGYSEKAQ